MKTNRALVAARALRRSRRPPTYQISGGRTMVVLTAHRPLPLSVPASAQQRDSQTQRVHAARGPDGRTRGPAGELWCRRGYCDRRTDGVLHCPSGDHLPDRAHRTVGTRDPRHGDCGDPRDTSLWNAIHCLRASRAISHRGMSVYVTDVWLRNISDHFIYDGGPEAS